VLYVGRLEPRKGVEHLIRAAAHVRHAVPDLQVVIVGEGLERGRLEQLAHESGAPARFVGRVTDAALPAYFQAADVVCSPALRGESFGIVLLEAMACGKPIVASRIAGYEGLVGRTGGGVLVPPGDADALAAALVPLLDDAGFRAALGDRGAAASHAYRWPAIAEQLDAIYQSIVE
jgi:phosphatidylinositol alpha-mannosyltransferase